MYNQQLRQIKPKRTIQHYDNQLLVTVYKPPTSKIVKSIYTILDQL
uniref:Uncharacterized protein n=1 Tax=Schistosoma japonicum TaxID=6182 RepID=Q5BYY4_SCHJA|nr:unknown [Schistosoma japonicum]